jgi:hypothetical protein
MMKKYEEFKLERLRKTPATMRSIPSKFEGKVEFTKVMRTRCKSDAKVIEIRGLATGVSRSRSTESLVGA